MASKWKICGLDQRFYLDSNYILITLFPLDILACNKYLEYLEFSKFSKKFQVCPIFSLGPKNKEIATRRQFIFLVPAGQCWMFHPFYVTEWLISYWIWHITYCTFSYRSFHCLPPTVPWFLCLDSLLLNDVGIVLIWHLT